MNMSNLQYKLGYLECMNDTMHSLGELAETANRKELELIMEIKRRIEENRNKKEGKKS